MKIGTPISRFLEGTTNIELAKVIYSLAEGCKIINGFVRNAALADITGATGNTNVQGEAVQKLDALSNQILMDYLKASETCAGYLSEENEGIVTLNENGKYTIAVDPLDGSSNIDVAAPIGTIFAVNERNSSAGAVTEADFLQKGSAAKAAGYFIYGSSTILVLAMGNSVNGFTLSSADNQFQLSHPEIKIPDTGKIYSVNQGNYEKFDDSLKSFISWCTDIDKNTSRPFSLRYIGSMVGDIHRTLLKGGIFIYPANKGESKGKLRLLYECIPMSFIVEQAGGKATNSKQRILDIQPAEFHERSAVFIGSGYLVEKVHEFGKA